MRMDVEKLFKVILNRLLEGKTNFSELVVFV